MFAPHPPPQVSSGLPDLPDKVPERHRGEGPRERGGRQTEPRRIGLTVWHPSNADSVVVSGGEGTTCARWVGGGGGGDGRREELPQHGCICSAGSSLSPETTVQVTNCQ